MILGEWKDIPDFIKNKEIKKYYDILKRKKIQLFFKRIIDIVLSALLLISLFPIFIILSIAIKCESKGPIFYRQERITKYGKTFRIFKFRTMIQNADKTGDLVTIKNDNRITKIGKLIRKCRLDELPQLINILIGDMSFVGTRPEVKKYVDKYTDEMKATLLMPAGVTSIASIKYKDEDDIISKYLSSGENIDDIYINRVLPEKMKYNLEYIKSFNLIRDFKICFETIKSIIEYKKGRNDKNEI